MSDDGRKNGAASDALGGLPACLLLVCVALMLIMLLGHDWQRIGIGNIRVGPLGIATCSLETNACATTPWWDASPISGAIAVVGVLALISGICAVGFSLACAGLTLARRVTDVPHRTGRVVIACAFAIAVTWQILLSTSRELARLDYFEMSSVGGGGVFFMLALAIAWCCVHRLAAHARSRRTAMAASSTTAVAATSPTATANAPTMMANFVPTPPAVQPAHRDSRGY